MGKKIIVTISPEETQAVLLEQAEIAEFFVERTAWSDTQSTVGNIYKGRVKNVLPGMQAAFVDIGFDKNAFLYLGNHQSVTQGQDVVIQIAKEAVGTKGPRATTQITLPGRYCVLLPEGKGLGVSRRIESAQERERLKKVGQALQPTGMGLIMRTEAAGRSEAELAQDIHYLTHLWQILTARQKIVRAPALLYRDVDLIIRLVRDYFSADVDEFVLDQAEAQDRVRSLVEQIVPEQTSSIRLYEGKDDLFSFYGLAKVLDHVGGREVPLPSGGYLVLDRTEALTVIDVNTGRFVGSTSLADTVLLTNLEAAAEIARQLRLRDIGGIIIIDFIDMHHPEHQQQVLDKLNDQLKKDRTRTAVIGLTGLGLVEMTRKKARQNAESTFYSECPCCHGRGKIQSPHTVAIRLRRSLRRIMNEGPATGLTVQVHPQVAEVLKQEYGDKKMSREFCRTIEIEAVPGFDPEGFSLLHKPD